MNELCAVQKTPAEMVMQNEVLQDIGKVLNTLTPQEKQVIQLRFFNQETLESIGNVFGVGRERIRQIEAKALRKMRHPTRRSVLERHYEPDCDDNAESKPSPHLMVSFRILDQTEKEYNNKKALNAPFRKMIAHEDNAIIEKVLNKLTAKQKTALIARSWLGATYKRIGETLGVSMNQARQIAAKAYCRIQHPAYVKIIQNTYLEEYLIDHPGYYAP